MTINDFLNMDISKLKKAELLNVGKFGTSQANRRLFHFGVEGVLSGEIVRESMETGQVPYSHAVISALDSGGRFNISEDMTLNQLRKEVVRARNFLGMKTSTKKGLHEVEQKSKASLEKGLGKKVTYEQMRTMFANYRKIKEINPVVAQKGYKYIVWDALTDEIKDNPNIELSEQIDTATKTVDAAYLQAQRDYRNGFSGVSEFFE